MQPPIKEISQEFSKANFSFCYSHFADDVEWKIVGNKTLNGRENVVAYCNKLNEEMTTDVLTNFNTIAENNTIAVEGTCKFTTAENKDGQVWYCDVYQFDEGKIRRITSYCI